jgi:hypothetical protein
MNKKILVVSILLVVLFSQVLISQPNLFWQVVPNNPLLQARSCAALFKKEIEGQARLGFFYQQPQPGFTLSDPRIGAQVKMQAALAPQIIDQRPERLGKYERVIGYFENEKISAQLADQIGSQLGLKASRVCGNYVLFKRVSQ